MFSLRISLIIWHVRNDDEIADKFFFFLLLLLFLSEITDENLSLSLLLVNQ